MTTAGPVAEDMVERDGLRLRLIDAGAGEPALIFQHGLCGSEEQVAEVLPPTLPFRRMTLECRGHGGSEAGDPADFSIAAFADDVAAAADARGGTRAVVGGISMGAAIALRLAVRRPDLVRGLILARPAWVTQVAPDNMRPNAVAGELMQDREPGQALSMFRASPLRERLAREAPDNLASLEGFFTREPRDVTSALLRAISADGPGVTERDVSAIAVPTLVVGHERDLVHPIGHARTLARLIPHARLVEITPKAQDKARYLAEFRGAVLDFLATFD